MIRRPPRSTLDRSSAASDVYKRQILVDTKYEFGKIGDEILLIDEIHTPDSSRYFYSFGYEERQKNGCLLYTSPSPRDRTRSRMPSSA